MGAAWNIAAKDLKLRLRDRSAYIMGLFAPLGLALVFGFALSPVSEFEFDATYAVADLDGGPVSSLFVEGILGQTEGVDVIEVRSVAHAQELVEVDVGPLGDTESGNVVDAAFVFPEGFSDDVQSERPVAIEVIGNQGSEVNAGVAVGLAESFASELTAVRVAVATEEAMTGVRGDRLQAGVAVLQTPSPVGLVDDSASTRQLDGVTFYAAGMAVFFLFFTVQAGVTGLLEERREGTLARLLSSPAPRWAILLGKLLSAFVMGAASVLVLMIVTTLVVDADWGEPVGVVILIIAGVIAAMGIVALVSGFARSAEQAIATSGLVGIILGFLGGTFFDVSQAGGWLARLRFLSPHGWFMRGLAELQSGELSAIIVPVLAMLAFGLVTGAIGLARLNKGLQL